MGTTKRWPQIAWAGMATAALLLALGCGDDSTVRAAGGDGSAGREETSTTLPPCGEERRIVVFDFFGTLTMNDRDEHEAVYWIQDPSDEPRPRPGGAELAHAYRELGYELLVVHLTPESVLIGELPVSEAIADWMERHRFPTGGVEVAGWDDTSYWEGDDEAKDSGPDSLNDVMGELLNLSLIDRVSLDAGYTSLEGRAIGFDRAGVPRNRVFGLGEAAGSGDTVAIPNDDLEAHAAGVEVLEDKVCRG